MRGSRVDPLSGPGHSSLTAAEQRIVELVCQGLSNLEIATRLYTSPETVRWHLKNVFRKLDVSSRTALAMRVVKGGGSSDADGRLQKNPPDRVAGRPPEKRKPAPSDLEEDE